MCFVHFPDRLKRILTADVLHEKNVYLCIDYVCHIVDDEYRLSVQFFF